MSYLLIILLLIIYLHYITWIHTTETFVNKMEYTGQDFLYNNNPRDPNYNYITYSNSSLLLPNAFALVDKSLYSIDY